MKKSCKNCGSLNYSTADTCVRCGFALPKTLVRRNRVRDVISSIIWRGVICFVVSLFVILGFYFTLVFSAKPLNIDEKATVRAAIKVLRDKGFATESMMLDYFTIYRSNDNWLNASVAKENAYAATNFPFEIMTIYSDFYAYPVDDTERAAILLHESRHLLGDDEDEAYRFVWEHREQLGWTQEKYGLSAVWIGVRGQTVDHVPELFNCTEMSPDECAH